MNLFKKDEKDRCVYFLHIPKTAGTSFTALIDNYFDHDKIYPEQIWHKIFNQSYNQKKIEFIRGHYGYSIKGITAKKPTYITMLRNPVDRIISFFDHMKLEPIRNNWVSENFLNDVKDIQDVIQDKQKRKTFSNNQTRYIAQDLKIKNLLKQKNFEEFRLEEYKEFIDVKSEKKCLDDARKRLNDFEFFGLVERFEESIQLLCYTFAWKPIKNIRKLMVAPRKYIISEDTKSKIEKINDLDIQLYEYAKNRFAEKYNKMIENLKKKYSDYNKNKKIDIYELLNRHYEENYYNDRQIPKKIDYDFSQKLFGTGWYYREVKSISSNQFFRWTGPETQSEMDLVLPKKEHLKIEFRVIGYVSLEILNSLELFVNNEKIELSKSESSENNPIFGVIPVIFKGEIHSNALSRQNLFSKLIFHLKNTLEIETISYTYPNEKRKLGIAIDRIKIE